MSKRDFFQIATAIISLGLIKPIKTLSLNGVVVFASAVKTETGLTITPRIVAIRNMAGQRLIKGSGLTDADSNTNSELAASKGVLNPGYAIKRD